MCGWDITLLVSYGILDIKELLVMIFVITVVAMMYHDVFATYYGIVITLCYARWYSNRKACHSDTGRCLLLCIKYIYYTGYISETGFISLLLKGHSQTWALHTWAARLSL